MSIQRQLYLERMKKLVEMDPKKHVKKNPENGMFCVYDSKGKKVKEFKSKEDAEKYATDNHDALMKEDVDEAVTANVKFKSDNAGAAAVGSETARTGLLDGGKKVKDGEYRLTFKNDRMKDKFMKKYSMKLEDVEQVDEMMPHGMNLSVKSIENTPSMKAYRKKVKQDHEKRMKELQRSKDQKEKERLSKREEVEPVDEVIQQYDHDNTGQKVGYTNKKLSGDQVSKLRKKYPQGSVEKDHDGNHVVYTGQYKNKKKNEEVEQVDEKEITYLSKKRNKRHSARDMRRAPDGSPTDGYYKKKDGKFAHRSTSRTGLKYTAQGRRRDINPKYGDLQRRYESVELSEADKVMINELFLFITNDAQLYRQRITPLIKNYQRKMKKGIFDQEMAVKGFLYAVNDGIKKYNKEFGAGSMKLSKTSPNLY